MTKREEILLILRAIIESGKYHYPDEAVRNAIVLWNAFDKEMSKHETKIFDEDLLHRQGFYHLDKPARVVGDLGDYGLGK